MEEGYENIFDGEPESTPSVEGSAEPKVDSTAGTDAPDSSSEPAAEPEAKVEDVPQVEAKEETTEEEVDPNAEADKLLAKNRTSEIRRKLH